MDGGGTRSKTGEKWVTPELGHSLLSATWKGLRWALMHQVHD